MPPNEPITGGARVGLFNATWPFAKLMADPDSLTLKVVWAGTFTFTPKQISKIERYVQIPFIGWGIRIRHNVPSYPEKMIFWYLGSPATVLKRISEAGFPLRNEN
jgi:hypothetical protein